MLSATKLMILCCLKILAAQSLLRWIWRKEWYNAKNGKVAEMGAELIAGVTAHSLSIGVAFVSSGGADPVPSGVGVVAGISEILYLEHFSSQERLEHLSWLLEAEWSVAVVAVVDVVSAWLWTWPLCP